MPSFQKIVLIISIVVLIISLAVIGVTLHYSKLSTKWPPHIPECPDYWLSDGSGNKSVCTNIKNLGVCPPKTGEKHLSMNFNNPPFNNLSNSNCAKYTWANVCKISWDGITYGANNPCDT